MSPPPIRMIETDSPDGPVPVYACRPDDDAPAAAVFVYTDVFGPREELFDILAGWANLGFIALMPNLFYVAGAPTFAPVNDRNTALPEDVIRMNESTTLEHGLGASRAGIEGLKAGRFGAWNENCGVVGYCMGGRHALAAAASFPETVRAGLSLHGGRLVCNGPNSPHLLIKELRQPFFFGIARDDDACPDLHIEKIREAALESGAPVETQIVDAFHGWSFPERWSYNADAVTEMNEKALAMFAPLRTD